MQRDSTKLRPVDHEQLPLIPEQRAASRPVSVERIYTLADTHEALMYGCELARLAPKQIYGQMGVDKTTWSRITSGEWDLDGRDVLRFGRVVNNDAYLLYLNHIHGYDLNSLRKVQDDQERRINELERENRDLRRAMSLWADAQRGRS